MLSPKFCRGIIPHQLHLHLQAPGATLGQDKGTKSHNSAFEWSCTVKPQADPSLCVPHSV